MKKIVHVVYECIPNQYRGGIQKAVYELALAQSKLGYNVEILTLGKAPPIKVTENGTLQIVYNSYFKIFGNFYSHEIQKKLECDAKKIYVLHAHNTFHLLNKQVASIAKRNNIPCFFHSHGALDPNLFSDNSLKSLKKKIYIKLIEKRNFNKASGIFALSPIEKNQLSTFNFKSPIFILENGINIPVINPPLKEKAHKILFIGRIMRKKRIEYIVEALHKTKKSFATSELILVGDFTQDISYTKEIRELVTHLNLDGSVKWLGFMNEEQKKEVLLNSTVFIHASDSEGMAMSILEALSYGLPTIVTHGCYMHQAGKEEALLEVAQNPDALSRAINLILENKIYSEKLSKNAVTYAKNNHSWEKIAQKSLHYYEII